MLDARLGSGCYAWDGCWMLCLEWVLDAILGVGATWKGGNLNAPAEVEEDSQTPPWSID